MSLSDADRIAIEGANFNTNLITAAVAAWIGYEYLLTIQQESRLFWKRKVTAASVLFFVNRYLALFYYVGLAYYSRLDLPYPGDIEIGIKYLEYLPWAVFSALRVHALSQKNWFLTIFTFFWSVLAFPVDYYGDFHHRSYGHDAVLGCVSGATTSTFLSTGFIQGGQIIADMVVIGVTWKAAYHARSEGFMSSLMQVMFRNGTLYFIVLLVLNILHILFIFLPSFLLHIPLSNTSYMPKFSELLTAILVSRFMLDLHEIHRALARQGSEDLSTIQIMSLYIGGQYSSTPGSEELEDLSIASNPMFSCTGSEPESGSETVEEAGPPIASPDVSIETV